MDLSTEPIHSEKNHIPPFFISVYREYIAPENSLLYAYGNNLVIKVNNGIIPILYTGVEKAYQSRDDVGPDTIYYRGTITYVFIKKGDIIRFYGLKWDQNVYLVPEFKR